MNFMKPLYILKIGGSVATFKNLPGFSVQEKLLKKIAKSIKKSLSQKKFDLILLHGAGAGGHQLAQKYNLKKGALTEKSLYGSLESRIVNQKLNLAITEIFLKEGLKIATVHTASAVIYKNNKFKKINYEIIVETLKQGCIPMLYGEMVFDEKLKMAICSGDVIVAHLSKKLKVKKIFFASDINGIFTEDPHLNKKAKLIEEIELNKIKEKSKIGKSHNTDTTGGLLGKIKNIAQSNNSNLETVEIFNGFQSENFEKILLGKNFKHTIIKLK